MPRVGLGMANASDGKSPGTLALPDASSEDAPAPDVGVTSSGVRFERERVTTPAPAEATDEWASFPSERPTSVPAYDVAAHAFETSLRHRSLPSLPLGLAIPSRTAVAAPADLELRAAFLLLHVDGRSSVQEVADLTGIAVHDVLKAFLGLMASGLVELRGARSLPAPPLSGERTKRER